MKKAIGWTRNDAGQVTDRHLKDIVNTLTPFGITGGVLHDNDTDI